MSQALLIVDLQNDFLPDGALGVPCGDQIIPVINQLMNEFHLVVASLDWHPKSHMSFASTWKKEVGQRIQTDSGEQVLWPDHCIQNTTGSAFPKEFNQDKVNQVFYKGVDRDVDSYSIFFDQKQKPASEIYSYLSKMGVKNLFIAGLATDYCVLQTALDAKKLGFNVFVIKEGCRAVNLSPDDESQAYQKMKKHNISVIEFSHLENFLRV